MDWVKLTLYLLFNIILSCKNAVNVKMGFHKDTEGVPIVSPYSVIFGQKQSPDIEVK